ncbi:MAG: purine-nucleoside phosphorylase [Microthrixaceae bacterium]
MTDPESPYALALAAAVELRTRLGEHHVALVLGSGWADAAEHLGTVVDEMPAHELSGFAAPTVQGHAGMLRSLRVQRADGDTLQVLVIAGRSHLYEGHDAATVVHPIRAAVRSGCARVVLTNAAGSLRPEWPVGSPVVISDHLNLTGANPMVGADPPRSWSSRFVDLSQLYSPRWREAVAARRPGLEQGVYAGLLGGSFETPAEIRMLDVLGADLVGMSTVLEAVAARHAGASVLGLSLVTNLAAGLQDTIDHLDVLDAASAATDTLAEALRAAVDTA